MAKALVEKLAGPDEVEVLKGPDEVLPGPDEILAGPEDIPYQPPLPSTVGMKAGGGWDFPEGTANPNASTFESMKRDRAVTAEEIKQKPWLARQVAGTAEAIKNMPMDMTQQVVELGQSAKAHPLDTLLNLEKQYGALKPGGPVAAYTENFIGGPAKKLVSGEASEQGTVPFELMNLLGGVAPAFPALGKLSGMSKANKIIAEVESSTELAPYRNPAPADLGKPFSETMKPEMGQPHPASGEAIKNIGEQVNQLEITIDKTLREQEAMNKVLRSGAKYDLQGHLIPEGPSEFKNAVGEKSFEMAKDIEAMKDRVKTLTEMRDTLTGQNNEWFKSLLPERPSENIPGVKLGKDLTPETYTLSEILDSLPDDLRREVTLNIHYDFPTITPASGINIATAQARSLFGHAVVEDVSIAKNELIPREIISQNKEWGMDKARVLEQRMTPRQVEECFTVLDEGKSLPLNRLQSAYVALYRRGTDLMFLEAKKYKPELEKVKNWVHRIYERKKEDLTSEGHPRKDMGKVNLKAGVLEERVVEVPKDLKKTPMENYDRAHSELARMKYLQPRLDRMEKFLNSNKSTMTDFAWRNASLYHDLMAGKAVTVDNYLRDVKIAGMSAKQVVDNLCTTTYNANLLGNFFSAAWNMTQSVLFYGVSHPFRFAKGTAKSLVDLSSHALWKATDVALGVKVTKSSKMIKEGTFQPGYFVHKGHILGNKRIMSSMKKMYEGEMAMNTAMSPVAEYLLKGMPIGWVEPLLRGQVMYGGMWQDIKTATEALKRPLTLDELGAIHKNSVERASKMSSEAIANALEKKGVPDESLYGEKPSVLEKAGLSAPRAKRYAYLASTRRTVNVNFLPGPSEGNPFMYAHTVGLSRLFSKYPFSAIDLIRTSIQGDVKAIRRTVDGLVKTGKLPVKGKEQLLREMLNGETRGIGTAFLLMGISLTAMQVFGDKATKKTAQTLAYQAGPLGWARAGGPNPIAKQVGDFQNKPLNVAANLGFGVLTGGVPLVGPNADALKILSGKQSPAEIFPRGIRDILYGTGIAKNRNKNKY